MITLEIPKPEALIPELAVGLRTTSNFTMVHTPLVVTIYAPGIEAMLNQQYLSKKAALQSELADGNYSQAVWLHERPYRLDAFLAYMHKMTDEEYWSLLGGIWTDSENIHENMQGWLLALSVKRPHRNKMMAPEELEFFMALPTKLTIHRGGTPDGLSWTLDKDTAEWFAKRFSHKKGKVHTRNIDKHEAVAYFAGRGESEIVWTGAI